jgi:hypothetical protein
MSQWWIESGVVHARGPDWTEENHSCVHPFSICSVQDPSAVVLALAAPELYDALLAQNAYECHLMHCRYCNVGVNCERANHLFGEAQEKRKIALARAKGEEE